MSDTIEARVVDAVARYVRFWNTLPDEQRRTGGETFAEDATYVAPAGILRGVEALADFTESFASNVGAYEFRARAETDVHHSHARLPWEIRIGDTVFAQGTDVLAIGEDSRVISVATFIDRAPEPHTDQGGRQDS